MVGDRRDRELASVSVLLFYTKGHSGAFINP